MNLADTDITGMLHTQAILARSNEMLNVNSCVTASGFIN